MDGLKPIQVQLKKLSELKIHPDNPRLIRDDKFKRLIQSIKDDPELMTTNPLKITPDGTIWAGNMRYRALKELKWKECPVVILKNWDNKKLKRLMLKDNVTFGEFDFNLLANDWDEEELFASGLDIPKFDPKVLEGKQMLDEIDGLPEFEIKDKTIKLIINFDTEDERKQFISNKKIKVGKQGGLAWSTWWPYRDNDDLSSLKYEN